MRVGFPARLCPFIEEFFMLSDIEDDVIDIDTDKLKSRIFRFLGKHGLNIPCFIGDRIISELIKSGKVRSVSDLYKLSVKDFNKVKGSRGPQISGEDIYNNLHYNKETTLPDFISGLGIPGVNINKARVLAKHFPIFGKLVNADRFDLERINCFSEQTTNAILNFFEDEENTDFIWELREEVGITWK